MNNLMEIYGFETDNFRVTVEAVPEHIPIADCYDPCCFDIEDMEQKVRNGNAVWFAAVAKVIHKPTGREIGMDSLGGLYFDRYRDFRTQGEGCFRGLVWEAVQDARSFAERFRGLPLHGPDADSVFA